MDKGRSARQVADQLEATFYSRCPPFKRPQHYRPKDLRTARPVTAADDEEAPDVTSNLKWDRKKYDMSLLRSLYSGSPHFSALICNVDSILSVLLSLLGVGYPSSHLRYVDDLPPSRVRIADSAVVTNRHAQHVHPCVCSSSTSGVITDVIAALVSKLLIDYITTSYIAHRAGPQAVADGLVPKPKSIGYGIGIAFAIFGMQELASLCNNMFFYIAYAFGSEVH